MICALRLIELEIMKRSKQKFQCTDKHDLVGFNSFQSRPRPPNTKKPKKVELSLKEVSSMFETLPTPTSSSSFKCEPTKKCNRPKLTNIETKKPCKIGEMNLTPKRRPKSSKVKPYIVKMTIPRYSSNDLITIIDDKHLTEHFEPDLNPIKSLMFGCDDVNNDDSNNKVKYVFPIKVWSEKHRPKSVKSKTNNEQTGLLHKNLVTEVMNVRTEDTNSCKHNSPDDFVINSSHNFNNEIAKVYRINDSKFLLSMKPDKQLYFVGIFDIELLCGCLEVLGYSANKPMEKILTVYSCQGSSHLFLKASKPQPAGELKETLLGKLLSLGLTIAKSQKIFNEAENSVVFMLNRNSSLQSTVWPMFLENNLSFSLFPPVDLLRRESTLCHSVMEHSIGCICQENLWDQGYKEFNEVDEWSQIEHNILSKGTVCQLH